MWEVFLFVNPLGSYCLNTEQTILKFVDEHDIRAHFHFVAINNLKNVDDFMMRSNMDLSDIELRNKVTLDCYDAALTYKAATCQGQRKARQLLMKIQHAINKLGAEYNENLVEKIAQKLHIDYQELLIDKQNELINTSFESDQLMAREMNVQETPSTVIFNYNDEEKNGVLIDNCKRHELEAILTNLYQESHLEAPTTEPENVIDFSTYRN